MKKDILKKDVLSVKKYVKLILGIALFIFLLIGISILYSFLAKRYKPENRLILNDSQNSENNTASNDSTNTSGDNTNRNENETLVDGEVANAESTEEEDSRISIVDASIYDSEGNEVMLSSFIGKPIVINFWASWCSPCKSEFPDFQDAYEEYGEEITFIMINLTDGSRETKETADQFIMKMEYTLPVYYDTKQSAAIAYSVYSIPTTYFIDKDGYIIVGASGMLDSKTLEQGISMIYEQ